MPGLDLHLSQPGLAAAGEAQGMARGNHALQENRQFLHGRPLPRSNYRLDQRLTSPNETTYLLNYKSSLCSL